MWTLMEIGVVILFYLLKCLFFPECSDETTPPVLREQGSGWLGQIPKFSFNLQTSEVRVGVKRIVLTCDVDTHSL